MMKERKKFQPVSSNGVCQIYELLHENGIVSFPITKEGRQKVDSLVASITGSYFGNSIYPSIELKAVAYLYFIIKSHPFVDGNKRTGVLTFETVCEINGLNPVYSDFTLDELAVFIEKIDEQDHQSVIQTLSKLIFESS